MIRQLCIALALLLVTAIASADTRLDATRRMVLSLPTYKDDVDSVSKPAQLEAIASAVATLSERPPGGISPRDWAALLVTIAYHESGFSERVMRGEFKPHEADAHMVQGVRVHRARGLWQTHKTSGNAETWDRANGDIVAQATLANGMLRSSYWLCARSGLPWPESTINAYAGRMCSAKWPGLEKRLATFRKLGRVGL